MKTEIRRYALNHIRSVISMPKGATLLTVGGRDSTHYLWAEIDPLAEVEDRTFEMFETDDSIHYDMGISREYVGTLLNTEWFDDLHVYEYTGV